MDDHPGGKSVILRWAGKDATETYDPIHPPDTLDKFLDKSKHLGEVDMESIDQVQEFDPDEEERQERIKRQPTLEQVGCSPSRFRKWIHSSRKSLTINVHHQCYNLMDFEAVARRVMKKTAWAYYSSGADDEIVSRSSNSTQHLSNSLVDNARKSLCISQDMVQAKNLARR